MTEKNCVQLLDFNFGTEEKNSFYKHKICFYSSWRNIND